MTSVATITFLPDTSGLDRGQRTSLKGRTVHVVGITGHVQSLRHVLLFVCLLVCLFM